MSFVKNLNDLRQLDYGVTLNFSFKGLNRNKDTFLFDLFVFCNYVFST